MKLPLGLTVSLSFHQLMPWPRPVTDHKRGCLWKGSHAWACVWWAVSGLPPGGTERLQEKHYKFGHCVDDLCRIFSFHIWPWRFTGFKQKGASVQHLAFTGADSCSEEENKVQTDPKRGFDEGEINSFSLAEAKTTGADAIKAAVIIFKRTSDPSDTVWKSADLIARPSPTSKEVLYFVGLGFLLSRWNLGCDNR